MSGVGFSQELGAEFLCMASWVAAQVFIHCINRRLAALEIYYKCVLSSRSQLSSFLARSSFAASLHALHLLWDWRSML